MKTLIRVIDLYMRFARRALRWMEAINRIGDTIPYLTFAVLSIFAGVVIASAEQTSNPVPVALSAAGLALLALCGLWIAPIAIWVTFMIWVVEPLRSWSEKAFEELQSDAPQCSAENVVSLVKVDTNALADTRMRGEGR